MTSTNNNLTASSWYCNNRYYCYLSPAYMNFGRSILVVLLFLLFVGTQSYAQEAPATEKPATTAKTPPKGGGDKVDKPRVKSPLEQATELCEEAESYKKLGKHDDAIKTYTTALEKMPEYYKAFVGRAGTKFLKLDFQGATGDYDAAIEMMENLKEQYETQAKIKKVFGDVNGEKIELDKINEIIPVLAEAYYQRGNVRQFTDDTAGACEDINKAKELGYLRTSDALKNICGQ